MRLPLIEEHRYIGTEFDWLAMDSQRRIALFSTAGFGGMPQSVLESAQEFEGIFKKIIRNLYPFTKALRTDPTDTAAGDWAKVAERGIYAFDWHHETHCYRLLAAPYSPLPVDDVLDPTVQRLAQLTAFDGLFSELQQLP